jgi:hypothetical protein
MPIMSATAIAVAVTVDTLARCSERRSADAGGLCVRSMSVFPLPLSAPADDINAVIDLAPHAVLRGA